MISHDQNVERGEKKDHLAELRSPFLSILSIFWNSPGAKYFFGRSVTPACEKVTLALERSYISYSVRKSTLDMPDPGSF